MAFSEKQGRGNCSLEAQAHIWHHLFNFISSMSLKCAVELRIPEAIHKHGGQPVGLSQLVSALEIPAGKAQFFKRLMRLLTYTGFFAVKNTDDGEEAYLLTKHSKFLLWDHPHSLSLFVLAVLDPILLNLCQSLSAWFRGDRPTPFHHFHGEDFWVLLGQNPERSSMFNAAMASDSRLTINAAITEHEEVFRGLKSLVDVGGGDGTTAMALAEAFPTLKCSVLEQPHVVTSAPESGNVEFITGDMFEYVPPANAVLLKLIIHDWSDEQCVKLLKLCKEAIPAREDGGKVIIVDMVLSEDTCRQETTETQYLFDLVMMVLHDGGRERREDEWQKLFTDAGFSDYKIITSGLGLRSIIELYP